MRRLLTLVAALLIVMVASHVPAQAQQVQRPQYRTPQLREQRPRAFDHHRPSQMAQRDRNRYRSRTISPRTVSPRFYGTQANYRGGRRVGYGQVNRARANLSPARRVNPRFYNSGTQTRASQQLRRSHERMRTMQHSRARRTTPMMWK